MKIYFVTFGTGPFVNALKRIEKQAIDMKIFDDIFIMTEKDLDMNFVSAHKDLLQLPRGYGYWVWKPEIIKRTLQKLDDGDILIYLDSGCHFNTDGIKKLRSYIDRAKAYGIVAMRVNFPEIQYTKRHVLDKFIDSVNPYSNQIQTGIQIICKSQKITDFYNQWSNMTQIHKHLDDSMGPLPEYSNFIDHRHDQSCFSLLLKSLKMDDGVIDDETYFEPNWKDFLEFPIHARRDRH